MTTTSVADAVTLGRREGLEAIRDKLAADLDLASPQVSAQIAAQLAKVLADLDELGRAQEVTIADVLAERRAAREASADAAAPAKRRRTKP